MEYEYFNILFNKIAVTPQQCVILSLSTLPLRPSSSLSFCSLILSFSQAEHTRRHLSSTYNESRLRAFKKLTEPFALNISYSSTSLSHRRSRLTRHPLPRSFSLSFSRRLRLTRQPASLFLSHPLLPSELPLSQSNVCVYLINSEALLITATGRYVAWMVTRWPGQVETWTGMPHWPGTILQTN